MDIPGFPENLSLVEFAPENASESLWAAYFSVSETIFREFNQRGRLPNQETVRRLYSTPNRLYNVKRWMVLDEREKAVAYASLSYDTKLSPDYESSGHICQMQIAVISAYRRKKIAAYLLKHMIDKTATMRKDTVRADVDTTMGYKFCNYFGGELIHQEVQYRSYLEDVDWNLVDAWCAKGRARFPQTTFESFQECPEKDIDEFCKIYTETINQRPVGDLEEEFITTPNSRRLEERNLKRRGTEWYTMISRERDGHISAITDIMYNPQEPFRIHQYFTGVPPRYRRRGLAKRIKAEMLIFIKDKFPDAEYITTTVAKENKPMRAINRQLAFRPQKTCYMFRWVLQDLNRRVAEILSASDRLVL